MCVIWRLTPPSPTQAENLGGYGSKLGRNYITFLGRAKSKSNRALPSFGAEPAVEAELWQKQLGGGRACGVKK
jgi:hypothetical protein